jgi:hypothetical protein
MTVIRNAEIRAENELKLKAERRQRMARAGGRR